MIELVNLTKWFPTPGGRHYVFRNLNFSFPDRVSIGLMGRNGAGKSTLMRLIGGLDTPDEGEVRSNNSISWPVGLSSGLQGSLTARDNVRFVCRLYGATGAAMQEKIRFVEEFAEIGKFFDMPLKTYSSGMRGRVSFGLSMAFSFDYYLIDSTLERIMAADRLPFHGQFLPISWADREKNLSTEERKQRLPFGILGVFQKLS